MNNTVTVIPMAINTNHVLNITSYISQYKFLLVAYKHCRSEPMMIMPTLGHDDDTHACVIIIYTWIF